LTRGRVTLALEFHPGKKPCDPAAEKKFKKLAGAHEVLSDPEKRQEDDDALIMSRASGSWYPRA
jgi:molecular chaperone DnaJ